MSDKASPYDNVMIESFFKTLKVKEVYMFEHEPFEDVASRVTYFIEESYNKKRLHSLLGHMPQQEFEYIFKNNKDLSVGTELVCFVLRRWGSY